jgi:hypothetical protein
VHVGVELQQQRVGHLVVALGPLERLVHERDRGLELVQRVNQHLDRVEHRLDEAVVQRDRLAVALERRLVIALRRVHVPEQVVGLG